MEQLKNLNDYISYVPQQINFFNRTLIENITLNFNNNSNEDIKLVNELVELLDLTDFINNLPNGINSYLGEKNTKYEWRTKTKIEYSKSFI